MEGAVGGGGGGEGQQYIGVWIPLDDQTVSNDKSTVLLTPQGLKDLAGLLKRNQRARFLKFDTEEEAWASLEENDTVFSSPPTSTATLDSPGRVRPNDEVEEQPKKRKGRLSLPAMNNTPKPCVVDNPLKTLLVIEKDGFRTPKIQELTKLAREITAKNNDAVKALIEANPRMLLNDCDLPTTLQEGCRYNALHIAAKCDNAEIIAYILNKVGSFEFMRLLYPYKSEEAIREQIRHVTNIYLNTPDKMTNETPLHFATKFLCVNAIQVLMQHPWIDLDAVNCKEKAFDILGSRADSKAVDSKAKKASAIALKTNVYVIPIWRDPTGERMPQLGPVASIRQLGNRIPICLLHNFPDFPTSLLEPSDKSVTPESKSSLNSSVRLFEEYIPWEISAFAGPTSQLEADELYKLLRQGRFGFHNDSPAPVAHSSSMINNHLATDHHNILAPHTPPRTPRKKRISLGNSMINSPLFRHSNQLQPTPDFCSPAMEDTIQRRIIDVEKGLERYAMKITLACNIPWNEEWKFMSYFGDITSEAALSKLGRWLNYQEYFSTSLKLSNYNHRDHDIIERLSQNNDPVSFSSKYLVDSDHDDDCKESQNSSETSILANKMANLNLDSSGYPTPTKNPTCVNEGCKNPARFCTCIAPSIQFDPSIIRSNADFRRWTDELKVSEESDAAFSIKMSKSGKKPRSNLATSFDSVGSGSSSSQIQPDSNSSVISDIPEDFVVSSSGGGGFLNRRQEWGSSSSISSSDDSFLTAESDVEDEFFEICDKVPFLLNNKYPEKVDYQVFDALKEYEDKISWDKFPSVFEWFNAMKLSGFNNYEERRRNLLATGTNAQTRTTIGKRFLPTSQSTPKRLVFN